MKFYNVALLSVFSLASADPTFNITSALAKGQWEKYSCLYVDTSSYIGVHLCGGAVAESHTCDTNIDEGQPSAGSLTYPSVSANAPLRRTRKMAARMTTSRATVSTTKSTLM
jgi:hypothetical protein